jgi:CheY-like chemotaxis protein
MTDLPTDATAPFPPPRKALVVDDEDALSPLFCEMLQFIGFETVSASNGADALAVLASDGPFDLLLTDVRMPGSVDGAALATTAKADYPSLMIVVITGFGGDALASVPEGIPVLAKPFLLRDLEAQLKRMRSSD